MLDRFWLILIFILGSVLPPVHAAQRVAPDTGTGCAMVCCAGGCECPSCTCAIDSSDEPAPDQDPAVPTLPQREQQRSAEPSFGFIDLVEPDERAARSVVIELDRPVLWGGSVRLEAVFCVWRI
jgi:hypothetical protein